MVDVCIVDFHVYVNVTPQNVVFIASANFTEYKDFEQSKEILLGNCTRRTH